MLNNKPSKPIETIAVAVSIASITLFTTSLISWGIEELKFKYASKSKEKNNCKCK